MLRYYVTGGTDADLIAHAARWARAAPGGRVDRQDSSARNRWDQSREHGFGAGDRSTGHRRDSLISKRIDQELKGGRGIGTVGDSTSHNQIVCTSGNRLT